MTPSGLGATVARHPITAYLALSFTIAWSIMVPAVRAGVAVSAVLPVVAVLAQLLPAVIVAAAEDGRPGVRRLLQQITRRGFHPGWLALAAVGLPALYLVAGTAVDGLTPLTALADRPEVLTAYFSQLLLVLSINLWEETALIHLPLLAPGASIGVVAVILPALALMAFPFRVVLGWLYHRSGGSLLVVGLYHAADNAARNSGLLGQALPAVPAQLVTVLATAGIAGLIIWRGRSSRRGSAQPRLSQATRSAL